jgi:hypothetical protein
VLVIRTVLPQSGALFEPVPYLAKERATNGKESGWTIPHAPNAPPWKNYLWSSVELVNSNEPRKNEGERTKVPRPVNSPEIGDGAALVGLGAGTGAAVVGTGRGGEDGAVEEVVMMVEEAWVEVEVEASDEASETAKMTGAWAVATNSTTGTVGVEADWGIGSGEDSANSCSRRKKAKRLRLVTKSGDWNNLNLRCQVLWHC